MQSCFARQGTPDSGIQRLLARQMVLASAFSEQIFDRGLLHHLVS